MSLLQRVTKVKSETLRFMPNTT